MATTIKITISDHGATITSMSGGKAVNMQDLKSIQNVAGMIVDVSNNILEVSRQMINHSNKLNYEANAERERNQEGAPGQFD